MNEKVFGSNYAYVVCPELQNINARVELANRSIKEAERAERNTMIFIGSFIGTVLVGTIIKTLIKR